MADTVKSTVVFDASIAPFIAANEKYLSELARQPVVIKQITSELVKQNTASGAAIIQFRGLTEAGQRFTSTTRDSSKGIEVLSGSLRNVSTATKDAANAQKELDKAFKESQRSADQAANEILKNFKKQQSDLEKEAKRSQTQRLKDQQAFEAAQKSNFLDQQGKSAIPQALQGIGFDPSKLNTGQIQAARIAINNLNNSFAAGRITVTDLQVAMQSIRTGGLTPLSGGAAIAAGQLGNLNSIMKQTGAFVNITTESLIRLAVVFGFRQILIGLISEFKNLTTESLNFDTALTKLKVTSSQLGLDRLSEELNSLSKEFGLNRVDLANAQLEIFKNTTGTTVDKTKILLDSIKLGEITFTSTSEAAKALSETIRIFGLNVNNAKDIADKLFVGTKIGKTDLKEIDVLFERVGASAKGLGVSFEEVLSAFAVLRKNGQSASEATSLLGNVFGKLKEGTPELNKLLRDNGFVTAEQAVSSVKLSGVLDILAQSANKGNDSFKELGKGLRFFKGESELSLGSEQFKKFGEELKNSAGEAKKAFDIVEKSTEKSLTRIKENLKNFGLHFTDELLKTLATLADLFPRTADQQRVFIENIKKGIEELNNKSFEGVKRTLDNTQKAYDSFFQRLQKGFNDQLKEIASNQQSINDLFKIAADGTVDSVKNSISGINREITEAQSAIKVSQKAIFDDATKFEKESFDRRLKLLRPEEQFRPIDRRIDQLTKQGTQLFGGGPEEIREGRERFNEALGFILKEEELNAQLGRQKSRQASEVQRIAEQANLNIAKAFDQESRRNSANSARLREQEVHQRNLQNIGKNQAAIDQERIRHGQQLIGIREGSTGNKAGEIAAETSLKLRNIEREINNFIALRGPFLKANAFEELRGLQILSQKLSLERQAQENLKQQVKDNEAIKAAEEARLREIQQIFKRLEQPVFDEQTGKLKKGFQSAAEAAKQFEKDQERLNQLLGVSELFKNPNLILELERLKVSRLAEIDIRAKQEALGREAQFIKDTIDLKNKSIDDRKDTLKANAEKALTNAGDIQRQVGTENQFIPTSDNTRKIQDVISHLQRALSSSDFSPESLSGIKRLFDTLKNIPGEKTFSGNDLAVFQSNIKALGTSIAVLEQNIRLSQLNAQSLPELEAKLNQLTAGIDPSKLITLTQGADIAAKATLSLATAFESATDRINNALIQQSQVQQPQVQQPQPQGQKGIEKADGGLITAGTGPRSDDVAAWLSRGEYVVNAASTRKFYSQLQMINAGHFADGGLVGSTTNVGDIHINVQGGDTAEVTLRNIGNGLQRMARRGLFGLR